ncbi:hypothetical protein ABN034_02445 [Actinopolymorpha sp. B11F2]|uniref:hypothetical protein n=1 Tax=Actinopolymorpha sp. B11F2 TaxID=3160862 RepID=UPI0032E4468D
MADDPSRHARRVASTPGRAFVQYFVALVCGGLLVLAVFVTGRFLLTGVAIPSAATVRSIEATPRAEATDSGVPTVSSRAGNLAAARYDVARDLLRRQSAALRSRDRSAYLATIDPRSPDYAKVAARTFDNLVRMGAKNFRFGSPAEDPGALTPERRRALGTTAWVSEVDTTFTLTGADREPWTSTLRMVFVERQGRTYVAGDREGESSSGPTPLWLTDKVTVVRGEHSLLIGVESRTRLERYARTADEAVPRVTRVWGEDWAQYVVVIAPSTQVQMERVVGVDAESQGAVAAVTTSVGRTSPTEASHIVINPATFDKIGSLGRLVVLTHETTHVAAQATVSHMPVWLSEGFADYVGFNEAGLSTAVIAQEFLSEVRESDAPDDLPSTSDFDPRADELDQAYEAAWTACSYIAQQWGEEKLVDFYQAMDDITTMADEERVYRSVLNTTEERFVAGWREHVQVTSVGG